MPYIKQEDRLEYDIYIDHLLLWLEQRPWQPGHFNYIFTRLILSWFDREKSYTTANAIMGVLDCVGKEFYRRHTAPYEDKKRKEHGDVI